MNSLETAKPAKKFGWTRVRRAMNRFLRDPSSSNTAGLELRILSKVNGWCPPGTESSAPQRKILKSRQLLGDGLDLLKSISPLENQFLARAAFNLHARLADIEGSSASASLREFYGHPAFSKARVKGSSPAAPADSIQSLLARKTFFEHLGLLPADLAKLLLAFSQIAAAVPSQFPNYLKTTGIPGQNKYDETVAKLDEWMNKVFCDLMIQTGLVWKIYSEELVEPLVGNPSAPFVLVLDPLDGSSNIERMNPFGTILGVYREDMPRPGRELTAAAVATYGPVDSLIYSAGSGVHEFVKYNYNDRTSEFVQLHENLRIPGKPRVYGFGASPLEWDPQFLDFKNWCDGAGLKVRYCGSLALDFQQVIHAGGVFAYPSTRKNPDGKLRLNYECNPISFIVEQAGGASWDGRTGSILDASNQDVDARIPFYFGNKHLIENLKSRYAQGHG